MTKAILLLLMICKPNFVVGPGNKRPRQWRTFPSDEVPDEGGEGGDEEDQSVDFKSIELLYRAHVVSFITRNIIWF